MIWHDLPPVMDRQGDPVGGRLLGLLALLPGPGEIEISARGLQVDPALDRADRREGRARLPAALDDERMGRRREDDVRDPEGPGEPLDPDAPGEDPARELAGEDRLRKSSGAANSHKK